MNINKLTHQLIRGLLPESGQHVNEVGEASSKIYPHIRQHEDFEVEGDNIFGTTAYNFLTDNDSYYDVIFSYYTTPEGENGVSIDFTAEESYEMTNKGELFKVMGTVVDIIRTELNRPKIKEYIDFITYLPAKNKSKVGATRGDIQRDKLYKAFIKKQIPNVVEKPGPGGLTYFYIKESYEGKKTDKGAPGTLKAKITKLYGGDVTIEKAKKLKNREDATSLDKKQANWFINFHTKNEEIQEIAATEETEQSKRKTNKIHLEDTGKAAPFGSGYKRIQREEHTPIEDETSEEDLVPYIADLTKYMFSKGLKIEPAPGIQFVQDEDNAKDTLGKTAYYDPENKMIVVYVSKRHPKDILRSFAHEMIHHNQNIEGRLGNIHTQDINEDDYLKELEREAYEQGNLYFRGWENSNKKQKTIGNIQ
jgi:hypothetical protein